jgi:hypothetical protein
MVESMESAAGAERDFKFPVVEGTAEENGSISAQCSLAVVDAAGAAVNDQFGAVGAEINQHESVVLVSNLGMVA